MVLGIVSAILCWIPAVNLISFITGTIGIILGGIGKAKGRPCALAGLILSIIAIAIAVVEYFIIGAAALS